jgi:hypothetical protein
MTEDNIARVNYFVEKLFLWQSGINRAKLLFGFLTDEHPICCDLN